VNEALAIQFLPALPEGTVRDAARMASPPFRIAAGRVHDALFAAAVSEANTSVVMAGLVKAALVGKVAPLIRPIPPAYRPPDASHSFR
jgi:hypothetical protein